jgi:hypothetical protein
MGGSVQKLSRLYLRVAPKGVKIKARRLTNPDSL